MRRLTAPLSAFLSLACAATAFAEDGADSGPIAFVTEQVILLATIVGAIAALPALIEFLNDRRKRRERIALSLDDLSVDDLDVGLAGLDALFADIADLIDRAKNPDAYAALKIGNEILIIGPPASGKKTMAQRIAKDAGMDRLIIVYNARNPDALAGAKSLIQRYRRHKVMLLMPRLDNVVEDKDEEVLAELDALIETTTERSNVLVVGTAVNFEAGSLLDNMFGAILALPGAPVRHTHGVQVSDEFRRLLTDVARFYLDGAKAAGFRLVDVSDEGALERIAHAARNPADVADIIVLAETTALYRRRIDATADAQITPEIIERSIRRVIVAPA